ncbi:MAG: Zn-ribbon domain-containing OB-fold protein [Thermodesulfobacteriota bacterium]
MRENFDTTDCYTIEGKLALPYTYFAGRVGSTFITTIRDQKKIMGVKCRRCDKVFVPPRQTCERCMEDIRNNWVDLKNTGKLVNFTVVRYDDKHLPRKAPFILGLILLEGADTPMVHVVEGIGSDQVKIGMGVRAVFSAKTTNTILDIDHFEPVGDK